jgi:hypothetical protein
MAALPRHSIAGAGERWARHYQNAAARLNQLRRLGEGEFIDGRRGDPDMPCNCFNTV